MTSGPMSTAGSRQAEECVRFLMQMVEEVGEKKIIIKIKNNNNFFKK